MSLDKLLEIQKGGELPDVVRKSLGRCYAGKGDEVHLP